MPKITYGLLDVHPTHRIQNPDPARAWRYEMPEACTLCHTNRTAAWAAQALSRQFDLPLPADLPADPQFLVAENIRALLGGDVLQRAVAVMALAQSDSYTQDPVARLWVIPFLLRTMEDPYPAVRHFAFRGLRRLLGRTAPGAPAIAAAARNLPEFDSQAPAAARRHALTAWQAWWREADKAAVPHPGEAVPLDDELQLVSAVVEPLVENQLNKTIAIGE